MVFAIFKVNATVNLNTILDVHIKFPLYTTTT